MAFYYMDMVFKSQSDVPDFGSIHMYYVGEPKFGYVNQSANVKVRAYTLLSNDISKLNLITNAADGSQSFVVDTGKTYILCNGQWIEWVGSNGGGGSTAVPLKWNHF